ncbi:MAG: CoA-transferase [Syntrophorhabdales bacterium]|jgi:propionate CoA-transferase
MAKIITAEEAARLIKDEDVVAAATFGLAGWAEEIGLAVRDRYLETGHPRGITFVHAAGVGDWKSRGAGVWAEQGMEGLVKRVVTSHIGSEPQMAKAAQEEKFECYFWPLGVMCQWYTGVARRTPGLLSKTGLGTFIDPRLEGGKVNSISRDELIKVVNFEGEEWLLYKSFPLTVALIRGTTADEKGNVTFEKEAIALEALPVAQAVKTCGGIVIVQVENLAKAGSLHPQHVKVPGVCVDYIVVATKPQMQTMGTQFKSALAGDIKVPETTIPPMPFDERKFIARRAAMELAPGPVNLGIGIPQGIANVVAEEGCSEILTLVSESGNIGGIPGTALEFGASYNGEAMVRQDQIFNWFDGGGLTMAFTGLGQTDSEGNINAGKFGDRPMGPGGFIDTTQHAKKVVFAGTFTAGGLEVKAERGTLAIVKEGKIKKFLNRVEDIAFSGKYAWSVGQKCVYVTERAVFELTKDGLMLTEVAPGIDVEKDILAQMEFTPAISPDLKQMRPGIFKPEWGELKEILGA